MFSLTFEVFKNSEYLGETDQRVNNDKVYFSIFTTGITSAEIAGAGTRLPVGSQQVQRQRIGRRLSAYTQTPKTVCSICGAARELILRVLEVGPGVKLSFPQRDLYSIMWRYHSRRCYTSYVVDIQGDTFEMDYDKRQAITEKD